MPDDYFDLNNQSGDTQEKPEDDEVSSWWIGRWAHVITLVVFCALYFPFSGYVWSWQVAATLSYIVFMFCCTCGLSFQDSDDFFGNLAIPEYMGKLLLRQIVILALISLGLYEWHHLIPFLPNWANAPAYRNISLWELGGILLVYFTAVKEATWMAKKIKQQFPEIKEPLDSIPSGDPLSLQPAFSLTASQSAPPDPAQPTESAARSTYKSAPHSPSART